MTESPWLTVDEAAQRLKLKPGTLRNYISRGLFPIHINKQTGTRRIHVDDVDNWLTSSDSVPDQVA